MSDLPAITLHASSQNDPHLKRLNQLLVLWINDILRPTGDAPEIRDAVSDLSDGAVLGMLVGRLSGVPVVETGSVGLSVVARQTKVHSAIAHAMTHLGLGPGPWTADGVVNRDHVSALSLLVELVKAVRAPVALPSNVSVAVVKREDLGNGDFRTRTVITKLTSSNEPPLPTSAQYLGSPPTRDAFDELLAKGSVEKAAKITELMIRFVNVSFFVPFSHYHALPRTRDEKLDNVSLALQIMRDWNAETARIQPSDVVGGEAVAILRCLYAISMLARRNEVK
ncbi:hypothetical protein HDU93_001711 [Gonapodya sp. JEL0774]|nr:hypothetical protein HDU93_001711 [Gonapodya sp. JEL0774]